ncbi:hypothetical protein ACRN9G_18815 [Shewanella frigidimarina]|uniref:hypothetical protein n=1 Tax=Shewanella frigidimarina TaxID=56812 RepID=UPI003D78F409
MQKIDLLLTNILDTVINLVICSAAILIPVLLFNLLQKVFIKGIKHRPIILLRMLGMIAVPVHELSHAVMCILFRHKIDKVVLFDITISNKALGYVEHSYNPASPFQVIGCLFIGIAPIFGGILAVSLLTVGMLDNGYSFLIDLANAGSALRIETPIDMLSLFSTSFDICYLQIGIALQIDPVTAVTWMFLVGTIGLYLSPSYADLKGSFKGFLVLILGVIFTQWFTTQLDFTFIEGFLVPLSTILMMTLCLSLAIFFIAITVSTIAYCVIDR